MNIVLISDTHCMHGKLNLPNGDMLIHAGDFSMDGRPIDTMHFFDWICVQSKRYKHTLVLEGNHDWLGERDPAAVASIVSDYNNKYASNVILLRDTAVEIEGFKIYGSPYTKAFNNWAFNVPEDKLVEHWSKIPDDIDVLITHGQPFYINDRAWYVGPNLGDSPLLSRIHDLPKLKLYCGGHIHGGYGHTIYDHKLFVNASVVNEAYQVVHEPYQVILTDEGAEVIYALSNSSEEP